MPLSIEQIRASKSALPRKTVETPELGEGATVLVRSLTCDEVQGVQDLIAKSKDRPLAISRRVVELGAINEDGSPLFVGEDVKLIAALPWGAVDAIATAVSEISGMRIGAQEDAQKN